MVACAAVEWMWPIIYKPECRPRMHLGVFLASRTSDFICHLQVVRSPTHEVSDQLSCPAALPF